MLWSSWKRDDDENVAYTELLYTLRCLEEQTHLKVYIVINNDILDYVRVGTYKINELGISRDNDPIWEHMQEPENFEETNNDIVKKIIRLLNTDGILIFAFHSQIYYALYGCYETCIYIDSNGNMSIHFNEPELEFSELPIPLDSYSEIYDHFVISPNSVYNPEFMKGNIDMNVIHLNEQYTDYYYQKHRLLVCKTPIGQIIWSISRIRILNYVNSKGDELYTNKICITIGDVLDIECDTKNNIKLIFAGKQLSNIKHITRCKEEYIPYQEPVEGY